MFIQYLTYLYFLIFILLNYKGMVIFTEDLENTEQGYIQFHYILPLFF